MLRRVEAAPGEAIGRSCLIYRDTGPGIDLGKSARDLPTRGRLFIGERAVRLMAGEFGMVDGESLAEALAQVKQWKDAYTEAMAQLEAAQASLRLLGEVMRESGAIEVVDEVAPAKAKK